MRLVRHSGCRKAEQWIGQPETNLNGAEIDAGFEQVGGEGVPEQVRMNGLGDTGLMGRFEHAPKISK